MPATKTERGKLCRRVIKAIARSAREQGKKMPHERKIVPKLNEYLAQHEMRPDGRTQVTEAMMERFKQLLKREGALKIEKGVVLEVIEQ